jgi:hypothetical protein
VEIELRIYSFNGNCLHSKFIPDCNAEDILKLFPNDNFNDPENNSIWIETEEQANYFGVSYQDIQGGIGYEVIGYIDESD